MSVLYCTVCHKYIDTDEDVEHFAYGPCADEPDAAREPPSPRECDAAAANWWAWRTSGGD